MSGKHDGKETANITDVSIIIVNYNTLELTRNCLRSVFGQTHDINFEVIVSDNGSHDGSQEMIRKEFPQARLIENNANLGFGSANNRGLDIAKGKYIFYLNSDTVLLNNAVKLFFDYWENSGDKENIGALGCNLLDADGNISHSYGRFPNANEEIFSLLKSNYGLWKFFFLRIFKKQKNTTPRAPQPEEKKIGEVEYVTGADLFMKNNGFARFDEQYFLYCEETDLQYALEKNQKKRLLIEGPKIIHLGGQSSEGFDPSPFYEITNFASRWNSISRLIFYRKHISTAKYFVAKILMIAMWLNPVIIKKTKGTFFQLLKA